MALKAAILERAQNLFEQLRRCPPGIAFLGMIRVSENLIQFVLQVPCHCILHGSMKN